MKPRFSARLLFAGIGAAACLIAALVLEGVYGLSHTGRWLDDGETAVLLFFPHNSSETARRLREANANSGDVEITLSWDNLNDLDLHCFDPGNHEVYYGSKGSPSTEGVLDVDRNFQVPYTNQPVEHIYWPRGRAPMGRYRVYVDHYMRHGAVDATKYQVIIKEYGRVYHYSGVITHAEHRTDSPGRLITEFTVGRTNFFAGLPAVFWRALFVMACWAAVVAGAIGASFLAGLHLFYRRVYRKPFLKLAQAGRILGFSALWSLAGGIVGQAVFSLLPAPLRNPHPTVAHIIGLALLASILAMALGGRVPHLRRLKAFLAGLVAGVLTGRLFLAVYWLFGESIRSESWSRVATAVAIGTLVGLVVELVVEPPPPPPEPPEEIGDVSLDSLQPLSLRANRIGPTGKLRRAGGEQVRR